MKLFLIIATIFTLNYASEYTSLHPTNLVDFFVSKGAGVNDGAVVSYVATIKLTKDAAKDSDGWYVPSGWQSYKVYFPPGTSYSTLVFTARPNSTYRVHLTFKADGSRSIDHYNATYTKSFLEDKQTREFRIRNVGSLRLDADMINSNNGGWLYIDIVEDAANLASDFGDVDPSIAISIASTISDKVLFNSWKNSIDLLEDGRPGDAMDTMTIIDKRANNSKVIRTIAMDPAIDPNGDEDQDGSLNKDDCDDYDPSIRPGVDDIPNNGIDENCDGFDKVDLTILDADNDNYMANVDCNDSNANVNPGVSEIPNNGLDDDCKDGSFYDGTLDIDGDGAIADDDCDDADANRYPSATEIPNNGIDEDCENGDLIIRDILDNDGDGFTPAQGDCRDDLPFVHPGATEIAGNGLDDDCVGGDEPKPASECQWFEDCYEGSKPTPVIEEDKDNDNFTVAQGDCNDNDPAINPDATEIIGNDIDEDCDGDAKPEPEEPIIDRKREAQITKTAIEKKVYTFKGVFSEYLFYDKNSSNSFKNWVFIDPVGTTYQMFGNEPTVINVFGWKKIAPLKNRPTPNWYMFNVDIDEDGEIGKFEWVLVSADPNSKQVYKLAGANSSGSFLYSDRIDINYTLINGQVVQFE